MRQDSRLTKPGQFALVYRQGRSWSSGPLVLRTMPNGLPVTRYGFSVSRRIGNAVTRNLVKRRLREIMRVEGVRVGYDIVIVARTSAPQAGFAGLKVAAVALLTKAKLLTGPAKTPPAEVGAAGDAGRTE